MPKSRRRPKPKKDRALPLTLDDALNSIKDLDKKIGQMIQDQDLKRPKPRKGSKDEGKGPSK